MDLKKIFIKQDTSQVRRYQQANSNQKGFRTRTRDYSKAKENATNNKVRYGSPVLQISLSKYRSSFLLITLLLLFLSVLGATVYKQLNSRELYKTEGEKRYEVAIELPPTRGRIEDRNGVFLATTIPVRAAWVTPEKFLDATSSQLKALSKHLGVSEDYIKKRVSDNMGKTFVYLKRQVPLTQAEKLKEMKIPGLNFLNEVKRSYPQGPLMAHLVGFTNIENTGIEGLEKQFDEVLKGEPGKRVVIRDRLGRIVEDVYNQLPAQDGKNLSLTVDSQIQLLAYKAVEKAVSEHEAEAGGAVVVDTVTGEILAMASYPTYDPNNPHERKGLALRNRAVTDTFEPGSTIKPFVAALALDSGAISQKTLFKTGSGSYRYQGATITDVSRFNGTLDVAGIIRRSSNIGMTMISERLDADQMWTVFRALGFGQRPDLDFPGVVSGVVRPWEKWRLIEKATMSYGYGLSVSLMQMAQAYTSLARDGDMISLSLVKGNKTPQKTQVFSPEIAHSVLNMLEEATGSKGTKIQDKIQGYRIGGKSGTARQIENGRYTQKYQSSFTAIAPISKPRIVVAVTVSKPTKGGYFGTVVAGPVAAEIAEGTLKRLGVAPDLPTHPPTLEARNKNNQGNHQG